MIRHETAKEQETSYRRKLDVGGHIIGWSIRAPSAGLAMSIPTSSGALANWMHMKADELSVSVARSRRRIQVCSSPAVLAIFAQCFAVGVGLWWIRSPGSGVWQLDYTDFGLIAIVLMAVDALRIDALRLVGASHRRWPCLLALRLSLVLAAYGGLLMLADPFTEYRGNVSFLVGVALLLPFLLAISVFVRGSAWLAVGGSGLFFAIGLIMICENALSRCILRGFS